MNRFAGLVSAVVLLLLVLGTSDGQTNHFRLPNNTSPVSYDIALTVNLESSTFYGVVQVSLVAASESNYVKMNAKELDILRAVLTGEGGVNVPINGWVMQNDSEMVTFHLGSYLAVNRTYQLELDFVGNITNDLRGLYKSSYYWGTEERFVATTFNAAAYARKIFPCYDEPHLKAIFKLRVKHKPEFIALSNTPVERRTEGTDSANMSLTVFERTPLMSSYLFAFVVSDFGTHQLDSVFAVHAQASIINSTQYALHFTKDAIAYLGSFFQRPYQLSKLDIVAIDDFLMGAMENWGLITYKTSRIAYREGLDKTEKLQSVTKIVFHELIHQWFGNEATCAWWSYVWLNEGFTVFLESYILDRMRPEWRLMDQFLVNEMHPVMEKDVLPSTRPMTKHIDTPDEIAGIYDFTVYPKAASVVRMIHSVVGATVFDAFVVNYLSDRSYRSVTEDDMIRILQEVIDRNQLQIPSMKEIIPSWTRNPSYPVVMVSRFGANGATVSAVPSKTFYIPLKWISKGGLFGLEWLTNTESSKTITFKGVASDEWVLVNPEQRGYYRVNYDTNNWKQLIEALKEDHNQIPALSRAQLLDDGLSLARDNLLEVDILLSLLQYLSDETDLIPLKAGFKVLKQLDRLFRGNTFYSDYASYQNKLLETIYKRAMASTQQDHIARLYRSEVRTVACELGATSCLQDAIRQFEGFDQLDPDLRASVICGAIKGTESFNVWAMVMQRMHMIMRNFEQKRINLEEFEDIMYGFGCAVSRERLENYTLMSLSTVETLEQPDCIKMFNYIATSGVNGTEEALDRLVADPRVLQRRYGSLTEIVSNLRNAISTQEQLQKFTIFLKNHTSSELFPTIAETYEVARRNVRWASDKLPAVSQWISTTSGSTECTISRTLALIALFTLYFIQ